MNILSGRSLAGKYILAGITNTTTSEETSITYPTIDNAFYIALYNSSGQISQYLSSDIFDSPLVSVEFKLEETGCSDFTLTLSREYASLIFINQRIEIYLFGETSPRYCGYVNQRGLSGTTTDTVEIAGYGYYGKFEKIIINKTYEDIEVTSAVKDLIRNYIAGKTGISYNSRKMVSTDFTLTGQQFAYATASDVLEDLAGYADDYVYGVDELMDFFWKPRDTTVNEDTRLWVGTHFTTFEPEEDMSDLVNYFYVKYGEEQDDGSYYYLDDDSNPVVFSDSESIETYGYYEDVFTMPTAITETDVIRWAQNKLENTKNPTFSAKLSGFTLDVIKRNIKPEGMAVINCEDGTQYEYQVTEVDYKISGDDGITMEITLGNKPDRLDKYIRQLIKAQDDADAFADLSDSSDDE
ncbi:MAG: hypothetical protein H6Q73_927 [Firmicutes bacterium]|nr:hypothetical protein [Bacillota bacterium]